MNPRSTIATSSIIWGYFTDECWLLSALISPQISWGENIHFVLNACNPSTFPMLILPRPVMNAPESPSVRIPRQSAADFVLISVQVRDLFLGGFSKSMDHAPIA